MKIINLTRGATLATEAVRADSPFKRMKGLLGRKELPDGQALILDPCDSVHTFFMQFPIDVVFVDRKNKIVRIHHSLRPWRLSGIYLSAAFAIELPAGKAALASTAVGDTISFV
jgi:hypothetical protein